MPVAPADPRALRGALERPEVRAHGDATLTVLRDLLAEGRIEGPADAPLIVAGGRRLGRALPHGTVVLDRPGLAGEPPSRVLEVDRHGHPTLIVRRGEDGALVDAWVRNVDGLAIGIQRGGAAHPLWGVSDRVVRFRAGGEPEPVTVFGAVDWRAIDAIPPLAEPARLPAGGGTSLLNVLAALATDQAVPSLRYRGPYATEQLFWALLECFRRDARVEDPLPAFLGGAEDALVRGECRVAPLDWTPAPHERLFEPGGVYVQLRDGVEKVWWDGRAYYQTAWQGLTRREHRVLRHREAAGREPLVVASLWALGAPLEDHLVLDASGIVLERRPVTDPGTDPDVEAGALWHETLGRLLPLEATPLLASSLATVWPSQRLVWGPVAGDLFAVEGATLRLSLELARAYAERRVREPRARRRALALVLVRDVLGIVGPVARAAAAAWLEAQPPAQRDRELAASAATDRAGLAGLAQSALGRLLDALAAGAAMPPSLTARARVPDGATKLRRPPPLE